jgi:hypothetical protein
MNAEYKKPLSSTWIFVFFLILFTSVYFSIRIPFYGYPLLGEDGFYPDILINSLDRPNYGQAGRINGVTIHMPLRHPGFMYEIYALVGDGLRPFVNYDQMKIGQITVMMRFIVSLFSYMIWLIFIIILWILCRKRGCNNLLPIMAALLILANASFPLTVSIEQQLDNTSGVLFVGLFSLALVSYFWGITRGKITAVLIFIGTFLIGLGKNEWTITLILSAIGTGIFLIITRSHRKESINDRDAVWLIPLSVVGIILGNLTSYLFDPVDYIGGLGLINQFMGDSYISVSQNKTWLEIFVINRVWFLLIVFLLWILCSAYFIQNFRKIHFSWVYLYVYGSALFISFFFITFSKTPPRYFIPAYFVIVIGLISAIAIETQANLWRVSLAFILAITILQSWLYFGPYYADNVDKQNYYAARSNKLLSNKGDSGPKRDCILPQGVGENFNLNTEYINISIGWDERKQILAHHGAKMCNYR